MANKKPKRSLGMSPDEAYISLDTNRYSVPENLIGKVVMVHKYLIRVVVFFQHKQVADHLRIIGQRNKKKTNPTHHKPLAYQRAYQGACSEEKLLLGCHGILDTYVRAMINAS